MKSRNLIIVLIAVIAIGTTVYINCGKCGNNKPLENKLLGDSTNQVEQNKSNVHYQCPMDCEKGKTYTELIQCPVCNMDLQLVEEK